METLKGTVALLYCLLFCLFSFLRIYEVVVCSPMYQLRSLRWEDLAFHGLASVNRAGEIATSLNAMYRDCAGTVQRAPHGLEVLWHPERPNSFDVRYNLKAVHFWCCHVRTRFIDSH